MKSTKSIRAIPLCVCALLTFSNVLAEDKARVRSASQRRQVAEKQRASVSLGERATKQDRGHRSTISKARSALQGDPKARSATKSTPSADTDYSTGLGIPPDDCVDQVAISGPGPFGFDNSLATDEGGPDHLECDFFGDIAIAHDLWYCWEAPPTDALIEVATCGQTHPDLDTKIAVYEGCGCPPTGANLLGCNDDACGFEFQSQVTFNAQASQQYLIRLGTPSLFGAVGGPGTFTITDVALPCEINTSEQCQGPDQFRARESSRDYAIVADDFTPVADADLTKICWWGTYADPVFNADCQGASPDTFVVRYYADGGGVPGALLAEFSQSGGSLRVTGPAATAGDPLLTLLTTGKFVGPIQEYEYSATHSPLQVTANQCYWVEISNSVTTWCFWAWEQSPVGDNRVIWDIDGVDPPTYATSDIIPDDQAFCLGTEQGGAGQVCEVASFCADRVGNCCTDNSETGTIGCESLSCCERVCTCDNFCCEIAWDDECACGGTCGARVLCGSECGSVILVDSTPVDQGTLWRSQKNIMRLTFSCNIAQPLPGQIEIVELLSGGGYGPDLSATFTFAVEDNEGEVPRILKIQDNGATLQHRTWYAVRNVGNWAGVADFEIQYLLQMGDADGNGIVISLDVGAVNSGIPCFIDCGDDNRLDIDGDGRVISLDVGVVNGHIGSFSVPKPDGH